MSPLPHCCIDDRKFHARSIKLRSRARRAFTLIEILIVIAIIALLAAILFPVFSRARESARRSSCASNLRQMMLAANQYAQDHDERLPCDEPYPRLQFSYPAMERIPSNPACAITSTNCVLWSWPDLLSPYVSNAQIFNDPSSDNESFPDCTMPSGSACPNHGSPYHVPTQPAIYRGPQELMYRYDYHGDGADSGSRASLGYTYLYPTGYSVNPKVGILLADVEYPSEKALICDGWGRASSSLTYMLPRHLRGLNVAYVDGHVKWQAWDTLENRTSATTQAGKRFWFLNGEDQ
jgi:prepilin-type N-terminal cleavage/methylation domain-containing protein/prepilin-type processing-associated H-X9-DG protein